MKTNYEITGFHKLAEIDVYNSGCQLEGGYSTFINYPLSSDTIEGLKAKILSFVDAESDSMEINSCDEIGRIDIGKTENADYYAPSKHELEQWKNGEIILYYAVYTCYVERVTREAVTL